jgi:hypothetical protein
MMSVDQRVALDLNDLSMDVFELADRGLAVESLTAGHGTIKWAPLALGKPAAAAAAPTNSDELVTALLALRQRVYGVTKPDGDCYPAT